ncbi:hypothetical protein DUI87_19050 [Hirundo rustica rustica]|uniref:Uncharacterized protein n=1 Tax=Hirundo rustica rustica TaxID=333673 RepID=A0A3M0JVK8_HIRRU|nr:hypothetical protein DUI87_19050 [Hirundo rustica rustica]
MVKLLLPQEEFAATMESSPALLLLFRGVPRGGGNNPSALERAVSGEEPFPVDFVLDNGSPASVTSPVLGSSTLPFLLLVPTVRNQEVMDLEARTQNRGLSCLLNLYIIAGQVPTEYLLWERTWKRSLKELLPELLRVPDCTFDADGNQIILDHSCGEGDWIVAPKQAEKIPQPVLEHVKRAAEKALVTMTTRDPKFSYVNVKQSPLKSFLDFAERLRMVIEQQVESQFVQLEVMTEIAQANANDTYKQIIVAFTLNPPPTLEMMVEA